MTVKMVHYLNQFFAGIGQEEMAHIPPRVIKGAVGPGKVLQQYLGEEITIVGTVICGDNYINEQSESTLPEIVNMVKDLEGDLLFAGPAFASGRYGLACGQVCKEIGEKLDIPCITAMSLENPAVDQYHTSSYIVSISSNAAKMAESLKKVAHLVKRIVSGEQLTSAEEEGYIPRGYRRYIFRDAIGAHRAIDMLIAKVEGKSFKSEIPLPEYGIVKPAEPIKDVRKTTIALVSSGGIVLKGNPDRLESVRCTKWRKYSIQGMEAMSSDCFQSIHGGYENKFANEDPNRVVPLDVLREMEREGLVGTIWNYFYAFCGAMGVLENGKKCAQEMIVDMKNNGIGAVILTST